ncbi:hypothetical protein AGOR_G00080390 [Albula goreensis]|uniref:Uncharacterized protein n=1 Tax=Albula goreensis TaxID=1534307 RepID=A0A8T3DSC4_9TELE|nr:hypothetical protein AGOR_G00080390 [Albula goreensis]
MQKETSRSATISAYVCLYCLETKLILSYITTTEHKTTKKIMAASNSIANLNKGMKKTYRAQDVREETELKMRSYANWGEFLVPGPQSIALLGELVFISANTDFAINRFTPDKKYTYIKHPESFRACLMQVCNDGWKAFNTAHTNMDKIRLLSSGIPNDVKNVVQTLMQEDQKIVETLLPVQLRKVKGVSSKCFDLATHVEGDFQKLIDLISELLENCTSAKSAHQEALKDVKQAIEFAELRKKSAEEAKQAAENYHTMVNKELEESREAYKEAINSMPTGESSGSLLKSTVQMSQMKIEQSKQQLRDSRDEYHKSIENMKKCSQELDSILNEMRKLDVEEIDFETTIKMLAKGLEALGRVREQWTKMVQFFQMISNLIETCLNQNITDFVSQCEAVPAIPNYRHLDFIKDMLYGPAFQASNIAHLVHMISETYVQVSSQYLMDRISNLGTLMTLEPDNPEFKRARLELQGSCEEAQKGILELVQKNRDDFDEQIEKRIDTINQNLKAALPAPSREEQKAIEDTVRKDPKLQLKEISKEDEDEFV